MKKVIFALVLLAMPFSSVSAAAYIKFDGVDGESKATTTAPTRTITNSDDGTSGGKVEYDWKVEEGESAPGVEPDEIDNSATGDDDPQEASTDYFLEIKGVDGESSDKDQKGQAASGGVNVAAGDVNGDGLDDDGIEPDDIDSNNEQKSNFAILLSSGGSDGDNEGGQRAAEVLEILKDGLDNEGVAAEQISLNFEKITTKINQEVKLFGFIPVKATATVEIDAEEKVKVKFPWWTFLASGKDGSIGDKVLKALSKVMSDKAKDLNSIFSDTQ